MKSDAEKNYQLPHHQPAADGGDYPQHMDDSATTSGGLTETVSVNGTFYSDDSEDSTSGGVRLQWYLIAGVALLVALTALCLVIAYVYAVRHYRFDWFRKNVLLVERRNLGTAGVRNTSEGTVTLSGGGGGGTSGRCLEETPLAKAGTEQIGKSVGGTEGAEGASEGDPTTRLLASKPDTGASFADGWRSLISGGRPTSSTAQCSSTGEDHGQKSQSQQSNPIPWYSSGLHRPTAITVNYVSLRRCDRQQSSVDSGPPSPPPTSSAGNLSSSANAAAAVATAVTAGGRYHGGSTSVLTARSPGSVHLKSTDSSFDRPTYRNSSLTERRSWQMGTSSSRLGGTVVSVSGQSEPSGEQCRIIVEDVTRATHGGTSAIQTASHDVTTGSAADSRHSSVSSDATSFGGGGGLTRRGSLSPGGPNASAAVNRRGSNGSWTSWGSGHGAVDLHVTATPAETQFWVPPSVLQRSRARSLVPPSSEPFVPDYANGFSERSVFTFNAATSTGQTTSLTANTATMTSSLLECPSAASQRRRRASMHDALDHTQINASLYERPPMLASSNKQLFGNIQEENLGCVQFSLAYDSDTSLLSVRLIQAADLNLNSAIVPGSEPAPAINPFIRLRLLPDQKNQLQTRVHRTTAAPRFDETLIFEASSTELRARTLEMKIFHRHAESLSFSRGAVNSGSSSVSIAGGGLGSIDGCVSSSSGSVARTGSCKSTNDEDGSSTCIGQIMLPLDQVDLSDGHVTMWKGISALEKKTDTVSFGDVMFSLSYLPSAERLTIVVVAAKSLKYINNSTSSGSSSNNNNNNPSASTAALSKLTSLSCSHHLLHGGVLEPQTAALSNPVVKVTLFISGKKYKRRKTSTASKQRDTPNPVWNEALVFSGVSRDQLLTCAQLELVVCTTGSGDVPIAKLTIGANSAHGGLEYSHWQEMLNGRPAIAKWHELSAVEE